MERYLRVNLLGRGPRLMKKEFTGPRSHNGSETLVYIILIHKSEGSLESSAEVFYINPSTFSNHRLVWRESSTLHYRPAECLFIATTGVWIKVGQIRHNQITHNLNSFPYSFSVQTLAELLRYRGSMVVGTGLFATLLWPTPSRVQWPRGLFPGDNEAVGGCLNHLLSPSTEVKEMVELY